MFNLKLEESRILSSSISVISDFITEATFSITKEGLKLIAMDPANISMVILDILPSAFTDYNVSGDDDITINLENLKQALRRVKPTDSISLSSEKNKLLITILGKSKKKFYIPLLEKEGREKSIPELSFKAKIEMDAKEFRDYIEDAEIVGDALTIDANPDAINLNAGEAGSKVSITVAKGSDVLVKMNVTEASKAIYSIEYLKKMSKAATIADTVNFQFSADYPMRLDFKSLNKLQMSFILAPRIENK